MYKVSIIFITICISLIFCSCKGDKTAHIQNVEEVLQGKAEAEKNTISFEGRFVKLQQLNQRDYLIYLKDNNDSIVSFLTMMSIDSTEIRLLRKTGNNISLHYINFYNPVKKENEKIVRSMTPLY
jgi:hypothetical protein